ncbi:hypothetical protein MYX82_02630 [Acidobacteria bacterium AH-259-D05]|nr:hypothetical protein [Acidobacteria bacterium AH-259-D05]
MVHPQIAAFARLANGTQKANRVIEGQATLLGRTMHAINYDEIHDEIVVPQPFAQALLTFRGEARGEEAPIRVIQGPHTQLTHPDKLGIDPVHNEIFVPQRDSILVFPREGEGDVAPIRILRGPDTQLGAWSVAIDPVHDLLIVVGSRGRGKDRREQILIFNRTDEGNVKPRSVIAGPGSGLKSLEHVRVYPPGGWIIVGDSGGEEPVSDGSYVGVWSIHDAGDVPPRWRIGGPNGMLKQPRRVALDPESKTIIVSDKYLNAVLTYSLPEMFQGM